MGYRTWLEQIDRTDGPGALVWVGAGDGRALPLDRLGDRRLALVEPNPAHLPALRRLARARPGTTLHPVALAAEAGPGDLHLFNWDALNSLSAPDALAAYFPGLKRLGTCRVDRVTPASLVAALDLPRAGVRVWRIDAPGAEAALMGGGIDALLEGAGPLHLLLRCPAAGIYADGPSVGALLDRLRDRGLMLIDRDADRADGTDLWLRHDPGRTALRDTADRLASDLDTLRGDLATARADAIRAEALHLLSRRHLDDLRARYRDLHARRTGPDGDTSDGS